MMISDRNRTTVLSVILIITGAVLSLHGLGALIPLSWLKRAALLFAELIASREEVESLWPASQGFIYAVRLSYIASMWIGLTCLLAASDPKKYRALVDITIAGLLLLSTTCLAAGAVGGIPVAWFVGDAVSGFIPAVLLLLFRFRRVQE